MAVSTILAPSDHATARGPLTGCVGTSRPMRATSEHSRNFATPFLWTVPCALNWLRAFNPFRSGRKKQAPVRPSQDWRVQLAAGRSNLRMLAMSEDRKPGEQDGAPEDPVG